MREHRQTFDLDDLRAHTWKGEVALLTVRLVTVLCITLVHITTVNHIRQVLRR